MAKILTIDLKVLKETDPDKLHQMANEVLEEFGKLKPVEAQDAVTRIIEIANFYETRAVYFQNKKLLEEKGTDEYRF